MLVKHRSIKSRDLLVEVGKNTNIVEVPVR